MYNFKCSRLLLVGLLNLDAESVTLADVIEGIRDECHLY